MTEQTKKEQQLKNITNVLNYFRISRGLISTLFGFGFFMIGTYLLYSYFVGEDDKTHYYHHLQAKGQVITATVDPNVSKKEVENSGLDVASYKVNYSFNLEETVINGTWDIEDTMNIPETVSVTYLPSDPMVNVANLSDVIYQYENGYQVEYDLWLGLGALVISFFLGFFGLRLFIGGMKYTK